MNSAGISSNTSYIESAAGVAEGGRTGFTSVVTGLLFLGLTVTAFTTRKDFSFLGPILSVASFIILGVIIAAIFFPIGLGLGFSFLMVAIASKPTGKAGE